MGFTGRAIFLVIFRRLISKVKQCFGLAKMIIDCIITFFIYLILKLFTQGTISVHILFHKWPRKKTTYKINRSMKTYNKKGKELNKGFVYEFTDFNTAASNIYTCTFHFVFNLD